MSLHRPLSVVALVALVIARVAHPGAAPKFGEWSEPANLGPAINSAFLDGGPALSKKGLSLYFTSSRPGGFGAQDIWVAQRATEDSPWQPPVNLGELINTSAIEAVPALSRDEHWLFFNSDRPGGFGSGDVWVSWRSDVHNDLGWDPPINLGAGVNSAFNEVGAGYFANDEGGVPMLFFGSTRPGGPGVTDLYVSELMADGTFGLPTLIPGLSSPQLDVRPVPRFDGLELVFGSGRAGGLGGLDLWTSVRESIADAWSAPVNLGAINSAGGDQQPYIAADRRTLLFASDRPGGAGGLDLYVSVR